jgi:methanogenic corrinoid protein MtbC1
MERQIQETPVHAAAAMAAVIEQQIVPRLLLLNRTATPANTNQRAAVPPFSVGDFALFVIEADGDAIDRRIAALLADDRDVARVFLDCLSPVARELGRLWEEDRVSFTDVTFALGKLHQALHRAAAQARSERTVRPSAHRAYFAAAPGEQHTFGVTMLDEIFRLAGWDTVRDIDAAAEDMVETVRTAHFDVIGLSCADRARAAALSALVEALRRASHNREVVIMVGGPAFLEDATRVAAVGADCTAADAREALKIVEKKITAAACAEKSAGSI